MWSSPRFSSADLSCTTFIFILICASVLFHKGLGGELQEELWGHGCIISVKLLFTYRGSNILTFYLLLVMAWKYYLENAGWQDGHSWWSYGHILKSYLCPVWWFITKKGYMLWYKRINTTISDQFGSWKLPEFQWKKLFYGLRVFLATVGWPLCRLE